MINIVKSQPAPECLAIEKDKANGDYKCGDVQTRVKADFHNKCYICENSKPTSINIEHFRPHRGNKDLMFDWNNLFFACFHCNNLKSDDFTDILDCTNPTHNINDWIEFIIEPIGDASINFPTFISERTDIETQNTIRLLEKVFKGSTQQKQIEAENLRDLLIEEIRNFYSYILDFLRPTTSLDRKTYCHQMIVEFLRPQYSFTSFKITIIKRNQRLLNEFGKYLPS